ncbi:UDP-N-acetylmuramoyl-tripeptide--D-alanyl-D-alanine ligase [Streptacidiphilus sp. EB103A]|uniref:UDP-N-acetylmuramoyl-tripeptide--D-alanyl-D- alanine ligase n=1 Tax=Streptacidiphilus sp. EB103A TaxID=3156275 RepID=UPI00351455D7
MLPHSIAQYALAAHGRLHHVPDPDAVLAGPVGIDSRTISPGSLFACLPGTRTDGHDFAEQALANGATAVLATRETAAPAIIVPDVQNALTDLARFTAERSDALTVGITGSVGKTSAKDLLAQILRAQGPTVATEGSYNNELGLPLTVLRAETDTRFLVLEMGARGKGHIAHLASIARPRISTVLGVGSAHVGEFGSRRAIAEAKQEIIQALPADGIAVLNDDDPWVGLMAEHCTGKVIRFSRRRHTDVHATGVDCDEQGRARFTLHVDRQVAYVGLRLLGEHHVTNALAAAALAVAAGVPFDAIAEVLNTAEPQSEGRMQVTERPDHVTVVNDAFNASPESMQAALQTLAQMSRGRRSIAVLGEMAELGQRSTALHEEVGQCAATSGIDRLVAIGGPDARAMTDAAVRAGLRVAEHVATKEAALALLTDLLTAGDVVLVKGAHSLGLLAMAQTLAAPVS